VYEAQFQYNWLYAVAWGLKLLHILALRNNNNNGDDDDNDDDGGDGDDSNRVQTDLTIPANKPDIIIRDNERGKCVLIRVAISGDRNMTKKEPDKILKY